MRALDKNIVDLQKEFDEFRIKAPLTGINPLTSDIGLKEGITENSRFEVLEKVIREDGTIKYKRAGIIRPEKGKIWDNRFMAEKEGTEESLLGYTTFEKVSGGDFYPGMLIREIK